MGVSLTTVAALRSANHDAVHLRDLGLIRLPDADIVAKALAEGRIVLTFDLDFGDILAIARSEALAWSSFACEIKRPMPSFPAFFA
jgi:predicted nuclease of predicted toxin-antitoxin system